MELLELLRRPWPWYFAGPAIGLVVPTLLLVGNRQFGNSRNLRHVCAAVLPGNLEYFKYDWRAAGLWNLVFLAGGVLGGWVGGWLLASPEVAIADATRQDLIALGVRQFSGLAPADTFNWAGLFTLKTFVSVVVGGFLVGFGTAWAGGCTSGHGITGLANFDRASLLAVIGFFAGGLLATWFLLPIVWAG
jgi:uncharacterized membrane protein YedE/YeeE